MLNFTYLLVIFNSFLMISKSELFETAENELDNSGLVESCLKKKYQRCLFDNFNMSIFDR